MNIGGLETDLMQDTENAPRELLTWLFFFLCAALSVVTTLGIVRLFISEAAKFFTLIAPLMGVAEGTASIADFLTGTTWRIRNQEFDVLVLVSATLMVTIRSAITAFPLGVTTVIYLGRYASIQARSILKPALEILAGVPTAVCGFSVFIHTTPVPEVVFPGIRTFNVPPVSIVVGIMITPMVASISEGAMSAIPDELRQVGYGVGVTKFDVSIGIVVSAALSDVFSPFILVPSHATGETMAVIVAAGVQAKFFNPFNPAPYLEGALPMIATMAQLLTDGVAGGGLVYRSLFAIGLALFVITLIMSVISDCVSQRYQEAY